MNSKRRRREDGDEPPPLADADDEAAKKWSEETKMAFHCAAVNTERLIVPPMDHVFDGGVMTAVDARSGRVLSVLQFEDGSSGFVAQTDDNSMDEGEYELAKRVEVGIDANDELFEAPPDSHRTPASVDTFYTDFENDEDL